MARLTRRGFIQASSALAAAPALSALAARAQGPAPDIGNLRAEKDIVFAQGREHGAQARRLPAARRRDAEAHSPSFTSSAAASSRGNKSAGYIINDVESARRPRLHEHLSQLPAGERGVLAGADSRRQGGDPLDSRERREARASSPTGSSSPGTRQAACCRCWPPARTASRSSKATSAMPGVSSDVNASIGVYPLASAQIASSLWPQGQATPEAIAAASPTTYISEKFAPTIFIHGTDDGTVPAQSSIDFYTKLHAAQGADGADADPGRRACVRQQRSRRGRGDGGIDRSLPRSADRQSEAVSRVRWRRRGRGGGRGGGRGAAPGGRGQ